jgi:hypothetical protein
MLSSTWRAERFDSEVLSRWTRLESGSVSGDDFSLSSTGHIAENIETPKQFFLHADEYLVAVVVGCFQLAIAEVLD